MQGVTKQFSSGEAAVKAIAAGNDILEIVPNLGQAIAEIKKAVAAGTLSEEMIEQKCRENTGYKKNSWGLTSATRLKLKNLIPDLNRAEYQVYKS